MQTVTSTLRHECTTLLNGIATLLGEDAPLRDVNKPHDTIVLIGPHYAFEALPLDKKRLQSQLSEQLQHFIAIVKALLRKQPAEVAQELNQRHETIREAIEQNHLVWHSSIGKALAAVTQALEEIMAALNCLYDPAEGSVILVPDTNAVIHSPALQTWTFDVFETFEVLFVPTVLSELDALKIEHRNPDVRQKAQSVIRQIKEYRRRGPLSDGVNVVDNRIRMRASALEPRTEEVFAWLDPSSSDDRLLASCIEAMRSHSRSVVALVTSDINLQNKAEFARVPFIEPPTRTSIPD